MQIEQVTGGIYTSSFEDIEISYTRKNLLIRNLHLSPRDKTHSLDKPGSDAPDLYDLFIPEVNINGINFRKAYLEKFLEIQNIELQAPRLSLNLNLDDPDNKSGNLLKKDLYELLPSTIDELRIGTVRIQEASVKLNFLKNGKESELLISPLQLEFENFHLEEDNSKNSEKILFTDQFFLEADTIKGTLADGTYHIQLEALKVSSSDSSAFARNIRLVPLKETQDLLKDESIRSIYEIEFPLFYMYGLQLNDLYNKQDLISKEITVVSPSFKLLNLHPLRPGEKNNFRIEDLYPAIDKVLNSIQVNHLLLRNGTVNIDEHRIGIQNKLSTNILLAEIQNFVLDSISSQNDQKILFSDGINFTLNQYSLRLSDDLHLLQADELKFSSGNSEISAKGFKVVPDTESGIKEIPKISYRANAPIIWLHGVDMLKAYNSNNLHVDSLQLQEPSLTLTRFGESQQKKEFQQEDLYILIEDFLYTLNIDKILVQKGKLKIKNQENSEDAFVTSIRKAGLWNFRLDSASAYQMNKLFYADDFELEINDYEQSLPDDLHKIKAASIEISTLTDRIQLTDIQIFSDNNQYPYPSLLSSNAKTLLNIQVPYMILDGVDILNAYLNKKLHVNMVAIPEPSLQLGSLIGNQSDRVNIMKSSALYDLGKDFLEEIQVKSLRLTDGKLDLAFYAQKEALTLSGRKTNIIVDNFRFDSLTSTNPKRLFFADNVLVEVEDFETYLPDGIHIIKAQNFKASTEGQKVLASGIEVTTRKEGYTEEELLILHGQKGYLNLQLPEIKISGLDYDKAYYQDMLQIDTIFATQPVVAYTFLAKSSLDKSKRKINLDQSDFYKALSPYFELLAIENLILKEGKFSAIKQEGNQLQESTILDGISLKMEGYQVDSSAIENSQRFLYAKDIKLSIEDYKQELLDDVHTLTAKNLNLSTALQHIQAEEVTLQPKNNIPFTPSLTPNRYMVTLPVLQINGIEFDKVYKDNQLVINELQLQSPDIQIRHTVTESQRKSNQKKKLKDYDLYELIKGNLASLEIKSANLINGHGGLKLFNGEDNFSIESDRFSARVKNFQLDENVRQQNRLFYSEDVEISVEGYERKLADSLHLLRIENVTFSTKQNKLVATGTELIPRSGPGLLELLEKEKKDKLYHLRIPLSEFLGVHPEQLQYDSLRLESIVLNSPEVKIYQYSDQKTEANENPEANVEWQKQLLQNLKLFKSDNIKIKNASVAIATIAKNDTSSFEIGNINGLATNFAFDSLAMLQFNRPLFSERLQLQIQDYSTPFDDNLYKLQISNIYLDSQDSKLVADSIVIIPLVSREIFALKKGYETDQFTLRNGKTIIENLNYEDLFNNGSFFADSLILDGFNLHVYRDKRQPFPENNFPKMPQEMIRNLKTPFSIKGIVIKNGYVRYEEQSKGTPEPGFMELTNLVIKSNTISNKPEFLRSDTTLLSLDCYLMGTGHLQAYFEIPFGDTLNRHQYYGTLDEMSLSDFNPILEKTVFIKIRDGYVDKIKFEVKADSEGAVGEMEFHYRDLKVALVNKRTGRTGGILTGLGTLLANKFVVDTHNTEGGEEPLRQGEIAFVRDENRSVVNYWVKSMVNGFKSSIGL